MPKKRRRARKRKGFKHKGGAIDGSITFNFNLFDTDIYGDTINESDSTKDDLKTSLFINAIEDLEINYILQNDGDNQHRLEYKYIARASLKAEETETQIIYTLTDKNGDSIQVILDGVVKQVPRYVFSKDDPIFSEIEDPINSLNSIIQLGVILPSDSSQINSFNSWEDKEIGKDIIGNSKNNQIKGTKLSQEIKALAGKDSVHGGAGDDTIRGGRGNDRLVGQKGNDYLLGEKGKDTLVGGNGKDFLRGMDGNDLLNGGKGKDTLVGGNGKDTLNGGAGNDSLEGDFTFFTFSHLGSDDVINGGADNDTIWGGVGNDTVNGDEGHDFLSGDSGEDRLNGGLGRDTVNGGNGDDVIWGDVGNDLLNGGDGNDIIRGNGGKDTLDGIGNFNQGVGEIDILKGGKSSDTFVLAGKNFDNSSFAYYDDKLPLSSGLNDYALIQDFNLAQGDVIQLAGNKDGYELKTITEESLPEGIGILINGQELIAIVQNSPDLSFEDLDAFTFLPGGFGNELLEGGADNDTLAGGAGDDTLVGNGGNDSLSGNEGDDALSGNEGDDTLNGYTGNDIIFGDEGSDRLSGLDGNDILNGGLGNDNIYGGNDHDTIQGEDGEDTIHGDRGNDYITGNEGNDTIWGDDGNDILYGNQGNDYLSGNDNNDKVWGGEGSDNLYGGDGNDTLGGYGNGSEFDTLTGGQGADIFVIGDFWKVHYNSLGYARIKDYDASQGDKIQVSGNISNYELDTFGSSTDIYYQNNRIAVVENVTNDEIVLVKAPSIIIIPPIIPIDPNPIFDFNNLSSTFEIDNLNL